MFVDMQFDLQYCKPFCACGANIITTHNPIVLLKYHYTQSAVKLDVEWLYLFPMHFDIFIHMSILVAFIFDWKRFQIFVRIT